MHSAAPLSSKRMKLPKFPDNCLPEILSLTLFFALSVLVSAFHEPWFDEAQAWMIAHDASLSEILFSLPHLEGHPPLWHLLLMPFAKAGAPYELSIKAINIAISGASVHLLLLRSPFPRPVRLLLPFTYFIFYQYGVISRPYSLMCLAFLLCAMAYGTRMEKPFRYALCLMLLCLTSAYGILLAGGIAFCWLLETLSARRGMPFSALLRDKRVQAMACLLLLALLLIVEISPLPETYAFADPREVKNGLPVRLIYTLLIMPADAIIYDAMPAMSVLRYADFSTVNFIGGAFVGCILWSALLLMGYRKRKLLLLTVPFALFALFSAAVYFSTHHIGIAFQFFLFWLWVCLEDGAEPRSLRLPCVNGLPKEQVLRLRHIASLGIAAVIFVQMLWSAAASVNDMRYPYSESTSVAQFIKEHGLSDAVIMSSRNRAYDEELEDGGSKYAVSPNQNWVAAINAYFSRNIIANFNYDNHQIGYELHMLTTREECVQEVLRWREIGVPDLLVGWCDFDELYPDGSTSMDDYVPVCRVDRTDIWKNDYPKSHWWYLYLKKDITERLGLEEMEIEPYFLAE